MPDLSAVSASAPPTASGAVLDSNLLRGWLRLKVFLNDRLPENLHESTLLWAGVIGFLGAISSVAFAESMQALEWFITQRSGLMDTVAAQLPAWERLVITTLGGLVAGLVLLLGQRWAGGKRSADFMEAVVLGQGLIPFRATVVKSFSSLLTISSGGSIGREGPMVQLAAMLGSQVGQGTKLSQAKCRLLVACGAAAGISCAYHAPLAAALFVSEIILGSIAMESFGPLVVAAVIAMTLQQQWIGTRSVYTMPILAEIPGWQLPAHVVLGLVAGFLAPLFLLLLRTGTRLFQATRLPQALQLMLGGAIVGCIAIFQPQVCGNGNSVAESILNSPWSGWALLEILLCKLAATTATAGSGASGGVLTPTLFCGAALGCLLGKGLQALLPHAMISPGTFAVVGMGCFLAATTRAPIMAIVLLIEMTGDYAVLMPLMISCVIAFSVSRELGGPSIYSEHLRGPVGKEDKPIFLLHVSDLMKPEPLCVKETESFGPIAELFATHTFKYLYVVNQQGIFLGAIALQDLKPFLQDENLARMVIALDLMRDDLPVLQAQASLKESLETFRNHDGERLPVLNGKGKLIGSLAKMDVLLALAHGIGSAPA